MSSSDCRCCCCCSRCRPHCRSAGSGSGACTDPHGTIPSAVHVAGQRAKSHSSSSSSSSSAWRVSGISHSALCPRGFLAPRAETGQTGSAPRLRICPSSPARSAATRAALTPRGACRPRSASTWPRWRRRAVRARCDRLCRAAEGSNSQGTGGVQGAGAWAVRAAGGWVVSCCTIWGGRARRGEAHRVLLELRADWGRAEQRLQREAGRSLDAGRVGGQHVDLNHARDMVRWAAIVS